MNNTERTKIWRDKNPDKVKAANKRAWERTKKNPEAMKKRREIQHRYFVAHEEEIRKRAREWMQRKLQGLKEKIFDKLGHCCSRCGYSDKRALCIDHVNGGGFKELRSMSAAPYYKKVLADMTGSYQILCHNCNWIKRAENGEVRKS